MQMETTVGEEMGATQVKVERTISHLPNVDTKMVTKEKTIKKLHNLGDFRRMTITLKGRQSEIFATLTLKWRELEVFATLAGKKTTCPGIVGLKRR